MKAITSILVIALLSISVDVALAMPKFMRLPFRDSGIKIQQGWQYHGFKSTMHYAIDYIKGDFNSDETTWKSFEALAPHHGKAKRGYGTEWGNYVWIKVTIEGEVFNTVCAHLANDSSPISTESWQDVVAGQFIGMVGDTGAGSAGLTHLHCETSKGEGCIGKTCNSRFDPYDINKTAHYYPGNTNAVCGVNHAFIKCPPETTLSTALRHPPGSLIRADGPKVYILQRDAASGVVKKRWIYDEHTFEMNGLHWVDVITVSPTELDCYPEGSAVHNQTLNLAYWNGFHQGRLVRKQGTDPVYVVGEDGLLHHLNITESEFYSFGYVPSMINPVSSVWSIGSPLDASYFTTPCSQGGATVSSPPPSTTVTCTPTLNPTAKNFAGSGGSVSVSVSAASNCSWSVSLPESWIHASPLSGTGSTAITISVDKNPSTAVSRGNNVTIGGAIFRVDQDNSIATTPPPPATSNCATALSPTAKNFSGNGGSVTVNVSAPSTCTWGVSLPESWITSSASSGSGNGSVTITVAKNPSTSVSRGNVVTIGGLSFRVDQDNYIP